MLTCVLVDVGDPADNILPESDLRVHGAILGEGFPADQVDQVGGQLGCADVNSQPQQRAAGGQNCHQVLSRLAIDAA